VVNQRGEAGQEASARYLAVGTVRRPHGVRGELSIAIDTDRPKSAFRVGRVLTVGDARGRPLDRQLTVERSRPFKDGLLVKFREVETLNAVAEALRGATLLIPESESSPLGQGEVFYHQLVGLRVVVGGEAVGTVREVLELPGAVTLAVQRPGAKELLVPFVRDWIRRLDVAEQTLEIEPPEGLLDL
jgi:16S rRNA processing protein RimM